jgi:hypothetical protein
MTNDESFGVDLCRQSEFFNTHLENFYLSISCQGLLRNILWCTMHAPFPRSDIASQVSTVNSNLTNIVWKGICCNIGIPSLNGKVSLDLAYLFN